MSGKKIHLTALESRKQLLLVESELNRVQLGVELRELKGEVHHLQQQVHAFGSIASTAAKLAATFSAIGQAFTHKEAAAEKNKPSFFSKIFSGVRAGANIWGAVQSHFK